MNKYLIAMDLDDTLLNYKKEISLKTKKCLEELFNNGHIIVIVTGRIFDACYDVVTKLGFANYMVTDSGSLIYDVIGNKIIYKRELSKINMKKIIRLYNNQMEYIEFSDEHYYYKYSKNIINHCGLSKNIDNIDDFINKNNVIHSSIKMIDYHDNKKIIQKINEKSLNLNVIEMKSSGRDVKWLELFQKGISKFEAIKYLCRKEMIDKNNIICFGDNYNDIDMICKSKYGVAMGNAIDDIKKVAKYVTKSCDEDGIEFFLTEFFCNERINKKYLMKKEIIQDKKEY